MKEEHELWIDIDSSYAIRSLLHQPKPSYLHLDIIKFLNEKPASGKGYIKIKISLEAPEKTRTISESEFDKIYMDAFGTNSSSTYINLKKELFP